REPRRPAPPERRQFRSGCRSLRPRSMWRERGTVDRLPGLLLLLGAERWRGPSFESPRYRRELASGEKWGRIHRMKTAHDRLRTGPRRNGAAGGAAPAPGPETASGEVQPKSTSTRFSSPAVRASALD